MANAFIHELSDVATLAAKLTGADFNLASLIYSDIEAEYTGGKGATIRIPVPGSLPSHSKAAGDKTTALVADELTEQTIDVTLSDLVYSLVTLSTADYDLNIKDYTKTVLRPQTRAIAAAVESRVAAALTATPATAITYSATAPAKAFTAARAQLRTNGVPADADLIAVVGSKVYGDLLDAEAIDDNGKVRGFKIVESTRIDADDIIAFVPQAFALVVRAPIVPAGAPNGASIKTPILDKDNGREFAVTVLNVFDGSTAVDRSLVEALVAVKAMPLPVDDEAGSVELVEHGGVVRIVTA
jgi:hypothetical protein